METAYQNCYCGLSRPGPNIPLNLPIIQTYKVSILNANFVKHKINMTRMYMYILANKCWIIWKFSLYCEFYRAKGTFSTPKNDQQLVIWAVCSSAFSIWPLTHVTWHKVFYFKHTLCMRTTSLSNEKPIIQLLQEAAYYSKIYSRIFCSGLGLRTLI